MITHYILELFWSYPEINLIKEAKEDLKAKKKREKTVITGDMKPLVDSLPTVTTSVEQYLTDSMASKHKLV